MNVKMQPARVPGGGIFNAIEVPYTNGQTFKTGAVLIITSSAVLEATNPIPASQTNVYGVALQGAGTNPGYDAANSPTVVTGRRQTVMVAKADNVTIFSALAYNNTTQVTTNATLAALVSSGTQYGLRKQAAGFWTVSTDLTGTSGYVTVVDYDPDTKNVFFKFTTGVQV